MRKNFDEAKTKRIKKRNPLDFMTVDFDMWDYSFHVNVLLVPLAIAVGCHRRMKDEYWRSLEWDEKKAEKLLSLSNPSIKPISLTEYLLFVKSFLYFFRNRAEPSRPLSS